MVMLLRRPRLVVSSDLAAVSWTSLGIDPDRPWRVSQARLTARDSVKSQELHHANQRENLLSFQVPVLCLALPSSHAATCHAVATRSLRLAAAEAPAALVAVVAVAAEAAAAKETAAVWGCC